MVKKTIFIKMPGKEGEIIMKNVKKYIIVMCALLLVAGGFTFIYKQVNGKEEVMKSFSQEHKSLAKKYPDWFNDKGEFYYGAYQKADQDKLNFHEMVAKEQIPKELYQAMTTEQLFDAVEKYPTLYTLGVYDSLSLAIQSVSESFDAMKELQKREDIVQLCYEHYLSRDLTKEVDLNKINQEEGQLYFEAGILLQKNSYKKLNASQRSKVVKKIKEHIKDYADSGKKLGNQTWAVISNEIDIQLKQIDTKNPWSKEF